MYFRSEVSSNSFKPFEITLKFETLREAELLLAITSNDYNLKELANDSAFMANGDRRERPYTQDEVADFAQLWGIINGITKSV